MPIFDRGPCLPPTPDGSEPAAPLRVLLVEDRPEDAALLTRHLVASGYRPLVHRVTNAAEMRAALAAREWDLVLSDYSLPGFDAPAALAQYRQTDLDIPFIIVSGQVSEEVAVEAMRAGAHDFIAKDRLARLAPAIDREIREAGRRGQYRRLQQQALRDAGRDPLTGLPNRTLFLDRLERALLRNGREPDHRIAVLFLDLDRFQLINDALGHTVGDQLLIETSHRLLRLMRPTDTVARFGGDEFNVILDPVSSPECGRQASLGIRDALSKPYTLAGHTLVATASIGMTHSSLGDARAVDMMRDADTALHHAKSDGRDRLVHFDESMHTRLRASLDVESSLRTALLNDGFRLAFQPVVTLQGADVIGVEALLRWQRTPQELALPSVFMPTAEDTGLIVPMGEWVLTNACRQLREWRRHGFSVPAVAVNLSPRQLLLPRLAGRVQEVLDREALEPADLELELTESAVMSNPDEVRRTLNDLRDLGVRLALDDFGTGYSSLSLLRLGPFQTIKIDRSFVHNLPASGEDQAIVRAILRMAQDLGLRTIAEGVETAEVAQVLAALGCDAAQGFYFGRPASAADVSGLLGLSARAA